MTDNRANFGDKFDATLRKAMKDRSEEVPEGFVDSIMQLLRSQQFAGRTPQAEENFDMSLKGALVEHTVTVPDGFADNAMMRVRTQQEQKFIARMVWKERFILAGCLGLALILLVTVFSYAPAIQNVLTNSLDNMTATGNNIFIAAKGQWQIVMCMLMVIGTVIYGFTSSGLFRTSRAI